MRAPRLTPEQRQRLLDSLPPLVAALRTFATAVAACARGQAATPPDQAETALDILDDEDGLAAAIGLYWQATADFFALWLPTEQAAAGTGDDPDHLTTPDETPPHT